MIYLHVHKRCFCLVFGTPILTHHLVPLRAPDDSRPCLSYVCSTCDTTFSRPEYLEFHERMHTRAGERVFKCPDCDTWFASPDTRLRHRQALHSTPTPSSRPQNARESAASNTAENPRGANTKNGLDIHGLIFPWDSNSNKDFNLDMPVINTERFQRGLEERGRSLRRRDSKQVLHGPRFPSYHLTNE